MQKVRRPSKLSYSSKNVHMNGLDFRQNPLKTSCFLLFITPQQNAKKLEKNDGTVQRCCVANEQTER